jgi:hypothetical protein
VPETNIDMQVMYDLGSLMGSKGVAKVGFEYQYWKNMFGNDADGPAGPGAFAKTAMIRFEYHFQAVEAPRDARPWPERVCPGCRRQRGGFVQAEMACNASGLGVGSAIFVRTLRST